MSSVEDSDRDEQSLIKEGQELLKSNRANKNRGPHRGRNNEEEERLYHEAFRSYMFGYPEKATNNCKRIITLNPENPKPYFLLATMHEEAATSNQAELYKAVEYFFMDAYYSPQPDKEKWLKVGSMSQKLQMYQQAAYCYGRALKISNSDIDVSLRRAECLERCNETKKAEGIYKRIIERVSNSTEVYKKYAKLLFNKKDYQKARQKLQLCPASDDPNIKHMICETLLREKYYQQLYDYIQLKVIKGADPPVTDIYADLAIPSIQMLLICGLALKEQVSNEISTTRLWEELRAQYEFEENSEIYDELVSHAKQLGSEEGYTYVEFLLNYPAHRTIANYMYLSERLKATGEISRAISLINEGIKHDRTGQKVELQAQLNYLRSFQQNKRKTRSSLTGPKQQAVLRANQPRNNHETDEIFHSESEPGQQEEGLASMSPSPGVNSHDREQGSLHNGLADKDSEDMFRYSSEHQGARMQPKSPIRKTRSRRPVRKEQKEDPETIHQLIRNTNATLQELREQYISAQLNPSAFKRFASRIGQTLDYLVKIEGTTKTAGQEREERFIPQGIFSSGQENRRKRVDEGPKVNFISGNEELLVDSVKCVIFFMKQGLRGGENSQVLQFAEQLTKAHFFKWQNRILNFKQLKVEVYEMAAVACLSLAKYKKSIFFLKYLVNKFPHHPFYLTLMEKVTRHTLGKLTLNAYMKKKMPHRLISSNLYLLYSRGIQEMDNCFFDLALHFFFKALQILEDPSRTAREEGSDEENGSRSNGVSNRDKSNDPQKREGLILADDERQQFLQIIYLVMSTCYLQQASSRTVFNKLQCINRSAYCFGKYQEYVRKSSPTAEEEAYSLYNQGRWFSHVKAFRAGLECLEKVVDDGVGPVREAALNLMIIHKEMENSLKMEELKVRSFSEA